MVSSVSNPQHSNPPGGPASPLAAAQSDAAMPQLSAHDAAHPVSAQAPPQQLIQAEQVPTALQSPSARVGALTRQLAVSKSRALAKQRLGQEVKVQSQLVLGRSDHQIEEAGKEAEKQMVVLLRLQQRLVYNDMVDEVTPGLHLTDLDVMAERRAWEVPPATATPDAKDCSPPRGDSSATDKRRIYLHLMEDNCHNVTTLYYDNEEEEGGVEADSQAAAAAAASDAQASADGGAVRQGMDIEETWNRLLAEAQAEVAAEGFPDDEATLEAEAARWTAIRAAVEQSYNAMLEETLRRDAEKKAQMNVLWVRATSLVTEVNRLVHIIVNLKDSGAASLKCEPCGEEDSTDTGGLQSEARGGGCGKRRRESEDAVEVASIPTKRSWNQKCEAKGLPQDTGAVRLAGKRRREEGRGQFWRMQPPLKRMKVAHGTVQDAAAAPHRASRPAAGMKRSREDEPAADCVCIAERPVKRSTMADNAKIADEANFPAADEEDRKGVAAQALAADAVAATPVGVESPPELACLAGVDTLHTVVDGGIAYGAGPAIAVAAAAAAIVLIAIVTGKRARMAVKAAAVFLALCALPCLAVRRDWPLSTTLASGPTPPRWPRSYTMSYIFTLPYTAQIQPQAISYTVTLHRDASRKRPRVRLETLNGTNVMIGIAGDAEYEIHPRLDAQACQVFSGGWGAAGANALPDLTGWEYAGETERAGVSAQTWRYERRNQAKKTRYTMYVAAADGRPLHLHMIGQDITMGSHFGEYTADYLDLVAGRPDPELFTPPALCDPESDDDAAALGISPAGLRMLHLTPQVRYGGEDAGYDAFLAGEHGRTRSHSSLSEYRLRAGLFRKNVAMIEAHNAANRSYTMVMNRFGDWTREEFISVMLPNRRRKTDALGRHHGPDLQKHEFAYEALTDPSKVPSEVDWRGTGADSGVKDQALCGSCWTFGAVGAMESAWFAATGQSARFSEQQVMDCSWGYEPHNSLAARGCDGGGAWAGIGHIVEAGGIALLADYQYLGLTDYCRENDRPLTGKFKGFARVPSGDDAALMEAIYSRGPIAVSLDASRDSFTFYSGGVYVDTECKWQYDDLDHAMVVVGYGTDPAGDYWLVKNSWSTLWGDNGYIKVSRDNGGCGTATDGIYAVVDEEAASASRRR